MSSKRTLAVVIPTLNEARRLPLLLEDLAGIEATLIVADGGSTDETRSIARRAGARVVEGPAGRAAQLRAGADVADADWLFFVHADSRIPAASREALSAWLRTAETADYAHFRFALDGDRAFYRFLELGQRLRERGLGLAYGDQGLVVSREMYRHVAGYPPWPILEDVGMLARLREHGRRTALADVIVTSPRRYEAEGRWRGWLRNAAIIGMFRAGVSPARLARWFPRSPASPPREPTRSVVVFAKAPRPGYVKTRLAADLGAAEATRIYRQLGRATVDSLRPAGVRLLVYYDPPEHGAVREMIGWLGEEGLEYRPQHGTDLGDRLERAFAECFADTEQVCVVGTDIPGVGADTVLEAFRALESADVVVGPATDGGYYLLALRNERPELFRDVPWSTDAVLPTTLRRAAAAGARVHLLDTKTDVDTAPDVPPELLTA